MKRQLTTLLFLLTLNLVGLSQKESIDMTLIQGKWKTTKQDSISVEIIGDSWIGYTYWDGPTVKTECPFTTNGNEIHITCCFEEQWYYRIENVNDNFMTIRTFHIINGKRKRKSYLLELVRLN
jgi:excinuclease UvrABC helicase subunit UvrB